MIEILPLLTFTTLGGIAAGAYALSALVGLLCPDSNEEAGARAWLFPLVCLALLGVGLLGTLLHLGQPLRFINGLSNPGSMISQESYWAIAFGVLLLVNLAVSKAKGAAPAVVRWIGAIAACGLMVVTGLAYQACAFIPAWSGAITVPVFVVGDLAMGAGLCLVFACASGPQRILHAVGVAVSGVWLVVVAAYAVHLMGIGADAVLVCIGAIVGPLATGVVSALFLRGAIPAKAASAAVCILSVVGVIVVRGAFFAVGVW